MANYFVLNNTFTPYTYEDYIKPFKDYGEAYAAQETAYQNILGQASTWEKLKYSGDVDEYNTYSNYMNELNSYADDLAVNGLSKNSRAGITKMLKKYQSDIAPIEEAYNKREELDKEWRTLHGNDTSWIGNRPINMSLSDVRNNDYSKLYGVSGNDIEKEALASATAASNRRIQELAPKLAMMGQYYKVGTQMGYTEDEVMRILENDPEFAEITKLKDDIKASYNYDRLNPEEQYRFDSYINRGLYNGLLYKDNTNYQANRGYEMSVSSNNRSTSNSSNKDDYSNTTYLPQRLIGYKKPKFSDDPLIRKYGKRFKIDAKGYPSLRFPEADPSISYSTHVYYNPEYKKEDFDDLKPLAEQYGIDTSRDNWAAETFQKYMENQSDMYKHYDNVWYIPNEDQKDVKSRIMSAGQNSKIYEASFNNGKYEAGRAVKLKNIFADDDSSTVNHIAYNTDNNGVTSITFNVTNGKNTSTYMLPTSSIDVNMADALNYNIGVANIIANAVENNKYIYMPTPNPNTWEVTDIPLDEWDKSGALKDQYEELIRRYKGEANTSLVGIFGGTKPKDQNVEYGG